MTESSKAMPVDDAPEGAGGKRTESEISRESAPAVASPSAAPGEPTQTAASDLPSKEGSGPAETQKGEEIKPETWKYDRSTSAAQVLPLDPALKIDRPTALVSYEPPPASRPQKGRWEGQSSG